MKYFIDTEFIEGFHRPLFGRRRHFIDLISIGLVAEDGREYYAISNEFDTSKASKWVRENVIAKLPPLITNYYSAPEVGSVAEKNPLYKSNKQIAREILQFVNPGLYKPAYSFPGYQFYQINNQFVNDHFKKHNVGGFKIGYKNTTEASVVDYYCAQPEFYGYYADYDWVLFCSLFGTKMDLPKGFPMYCRDLKQMLDEAAENWQQIVTTTTLPADFNHNPSFEEKLSMLKESEYYPKQTNEHNALADAKWNFELYKFLHGI